MTLLQRNFNMKATQENLTVGLMQEVRGLQKAHKVGVSVPSLYYVEVLAGCLYLEHVPGGSLKDALLSKGLAEAGEASSMGAIRSPAAKRCCEESPACPPAALQQQASLVHVHHAFRWIIAITRSGAAPDLSTSLPGKALSAAAAFHLTTSQAQLSSV